jgi:hypothetical protein
MPAKKTIAQCKKKVIERFMAQYRGQPCEVCKSHGKINTYNTCGHHYVGKGYCPRHIVTPENIIVLCQGHHGPYGKQPNPHSGNPELVHLFELWVVRNRPSVKAWAAEHKNDTVTNCGKIPWRELYEEGAWK